MYTIRALRVADKKGINANKINQILMTGFTRPDNHKIWILLFGMLSRKSFNYVDVISRIKLD